MEPKIIWPLILMSHSPWKLEKTNVVDKISENLNPSHTKVYTKHEDNIEKISPAVDKTNVDKIPEKLNQSLIKDPLKQNQEDKALFTFVTINLTGSMPLDAVLFLLLIHMCGANRVAAASTVFAGMFSAEGLIELAVSLLPVLYVTYKSKRDKAELEKKISELQKDFKKEQDLVMTLENELENWRNQLRGILDDVGEKKEENKQKLQSVEKEITKREVTFDKPEELLKEKENLLQDQWKLDQIKKDTERQLLNIEKLMDPIELQITEKVRMDRENM